MRFGSASPTDDTIPCVQSSLCKSEDKKYEHSIDLRHEAISRLAERGDFSTLELAAISGHKTLQMLKRYTHLQAESLARKLG